MSRITSIALFVVSMLVSFSAAYRFTHFRTSVNRIAKTNISKTTRAMSSNNSGTTDVQSMKALQLKNIITSDTADLYQIVDVREPDELQMVSLPYKNVINLPLSQSNDWAPKIADGEILDKDKPTVCVCHHGMRSMRMATFLVSQAGFKEVYNAVGGVHSYAVEADPAIGTY